MQCGPPFSQPTARALHVAPEGGGLTKGGGSTLRTRLAAGKGKHKLQHRCASRPKRTTPFFSYMIVQCEAGKSASPVRQGRQGNAKNQPAGSQDAEDGCTRGANNTVVREKEGQAAAALNCDAVVPACCSACLAAVVAALAYWQHGHDPCRLPHHSRPPTASIGAEDRQEGLGPGYPQPGAGRHAAMCIS